MGVPTLTSAPSPTSSTSPNSTVAPGSASSFSTRSTPSLVTRYCLPPVAMTAYMVIYCRSGSESKGRAFYWRAPGAVKLPFPQVRQALSARPRGVPGASIHSPNSPGSATMRSRPEWAASRPKNTPRRAMTLEEIRALVDADLRSVDAVIRERLKSAVPLVDRVAEHIISGGGKRLRPLLVVLAARACGQRGDAHVEAAAFIEFIHTATLLHDDVVDGSSLRRGRHTANEVFGNQASVLVGDFVYSRAFQMMAVLACQPVMEIMAQATNIIAEGEVLQLMNAHDADTTEARYLEVIYRKTAKLFEAGAEVAAVLC